MQKKSIRQRLAGAAAAVLVVIAPAAAQAAQACNTLGANDRVVALNAIGNLMGRYSHLGTLRGEGTLAELFALKTEGVSWKTPGGPVGVEAMRARFARPDEVPTPGVLHMHAMLTPVIEIAGDGKTAKGVWDSFGPNITNPDKVGNWLWVKYAVDFVKEDGVWKIWHLQVNPVFNTPYDRSVTQTAKDRAGRSDRGEPGGPGADAPPPGAAAAGAAPPPPGGPASRPGYVMPKNLWVYDGKSAPRGPYVPEPYCHFDPKTAY